MQTRVNCCLVEARKRIFKKIIPARALQSQVNSTLNQTLILKSCHFGINHQTYRKNSGQTWQNCCMFISWLSCWYETVTFGTTSRRRHLWLMTGSQFQANQVCCTMLHWDCHAPWRRPRHSCIHAAWLIVNWEVDAHDTRKIHANAPHQMSSTSLLAVRWNFKNP